MKNTRLNKFVAIGTIVAVGLTMTVAPTFAATKNMKKETVYVITNDSGTVTETIVSEHLINNTGAKTINDVSNLTDIENVKGDEKFTKNGDSLVWAADGNDIYYHGNTNKKVPVTLDVKYYLNNKEITGSQLQGKSGKVKIVINYTNNQTVNGTKVPFIVMSGMLVDNETFDEITVDNGKVIDNGNRNVIIAMAAPGLKDSLDIDKDDFKLGDSVTIEGRAKNFECKDFMTVVTNSIFEDIDSEEFSDLNFDSKINKLDDAGKKLAKGSTELYNGINYMNTNSGALSEGVGQLNTGAGKLKLGTSQTLEGSKALKRGINQLKTKLAENLSGIANYLGNIVTGAGNVEKGLKNVKSSINGESGLKAAADGAASKADSAESYAATAKSKASEANNALEGIDLSGLSDEDKAKVESAMTALNDALTAVDNAKNDAATAKTYAGGVSTGLASVSNALGSEETKDTLIYGTASIKSGANTLKTTVGNATTTGELADGLAALSDGANNLVAGQEQLNSGAIELAAGMSSLNDNTGVLIEGINQLDLGAKAIKVGMNKYYNDGIKQLVNLYRDDLKGMINGIDDIVDAGKDYTTFTMVNDEMDSQVNFIIKTKIAE